jgi:ribosomal protein L14
VNVLKQKVNNGWGSVGDEIVCIVKRARPLSGAALSSTAAKVRRGDVRRAVIVRTKKAVRRPDGRVVRFDDNAAVLLNNKREMLGTRIAGVVSADLRMKGWGKIVSLAPKVRLLAMSHSLFLRFGSCRLYRRIIASSYHHICHTSYNITSSSELELCDYPFGYIYLCSEDEY